MDLSSVEEALVEELRDGLPLTPRPYRDIGMRTGLSESAVMAGIARFIERGIMMRGGGVVHRPELGFQANAMVVWDVDDGMIDRIGEWLGEQPGITLSYRCPRREARWPYNLFCMIHGRDRAAVRDRIQELRRTGSLEGVPYSVLFGTRGLYRGAGRRRSLPPGAVR